MSSPESTQTDVRAVVVTYNAGRWLEGCLRSCAGGTDPIRVIVVDNASSDGTPEAARRFPGVEVLAQERNLGFGAANNLGIRRALTEGASHVLLLNQDAELEPGALELLLHVSRSRPEYGILSPIHLGSDRVSLDPLVAEYVARGAPELISDLRSGNVAEVYEISFINAAGWLLTRRCLEQVGGFDPLFFVYGEDEDYCRRARWLGFRVGLVPGATLLHHRAGETGRPRRVSVRSRANREFAAAVLTLKRPQRSFARNLAAALLDVADHFVRSAAAGDRRRAFAILLGSARALRRLPAIRRHRRLSMVRGPNWLHLS